MKSIWSKKIRLVVIVLSCCFVKTTSIHTFAHDLDCVVVNINTASAKELQQLPSIGVKRAQAIIAYRTKHHFGSIYELTNIKGIGRKTIAKLRNKVVVQGKTILTKTKKK